jgi:hypothetical protein
MSGNCSATFREQNGTHTHDCADYDDHSAGFHMCCTCGIMWGHKGIRATSNGWEHDSHL